MITLKKYLDSPLIGSEYLASPEEETILPALLAAYGSALMEMGDCSVVAIPALGDGLKQSLARLQARLSIDMNREAVMGMDQSVQEKLRDWGKFTALHYHQKTHEVRDLLFVIASTTESVAVRDQLCASQFNQVTTCLKRIATLEDLTEIRASIEKSVAELQASIQRMQEEGKVAVERLRKEVSSYRARLEEAENISSRDVLTGLRNRLWVENQIASRIRMGIQFCVAIIDIDGFKHVNDQYGHVIGDDVLKHFANELRSACRSTDRLGRWGGDEFILVLDGNLPDATAQINRLSNWVFGSYSIDGKAASGKIWLQASIGLAEHQSGEAMKDLLVRADTSMYERKMASRQARSLEK